MKKLRLKRKYKIILIILLSIVLIYSGYKIIKFQTDLHSNKKYNEKLADRVVEDIELPVNGDDSKKEKTFRVDFDELLSINKDTIGWIRFNQDKINYPIVHTNNNSYYLRRTFAKKYNQAGAIFMDYRNKSFEDRNVVLFGHSLTDGTMFGSLNDVFKKEFFDTEENNYIKIANKDNEILTYQIFSFYIIEKEEYYITTSFNTDKSFLSFIKTIKNRSRKDMGVEVGVEDKILTLSTCSGIGDTSKRKVIHAKLIPKEIEEAK